jgi:hypothetical protein
MTTTTAHKRLIPPFFWIGDNLYPTSDINYLSSPNNQLILKLAIRFPSALTFPTEGQWTENQNCYSKLLWVPNVLHLFLQKACCLVRNACVLIGSHYPQRRRASVLWAVLHTVQFDQKSDPNRNAVFEILNRFAGLTCRLVAATDEQHIRSSSQLCSWSNRVVSVSNVGPFLTRRQHIQTSSELLWSRSAAPNTEAEGNLQVISLFPRTSSLTLLYFKTTLASPARAGQLVTVHTHNGPDDQNQMRGKQRAFSSLPCPDRFSGEHPEMKQPKCDTVHSPACDRGAVMHFISFQ